ncbi:unnamed protein product [marine sediment metagenome]|uniref:Uncharacterized protein n=1 Tax=marine sediment metagenome TaxID=412755 RepID=X0T7M3_9ZZZZ
MSMERTSLNKATTYGQDKYKKGGNEHVNATGPDPKYRAVLGYYPARNGNQTLKELIK